jgi:hypothetical protein
MRLWTEDKRFKVVCAGRRSGKTELAKRRLVVALAEKRPWPDARYFAAAPTRMQAKRIFWEDLKAMIPGPWIMRVYETDLCIRTRSGAEIWVVGLDKPQRIEGSSWDGAVLDEFADMKGDAWPEHIRPALSDRGGWCWFLGVPAGFNHYKDIRDYAASGEDPDWAVYAWHSADILPASEVQAAKRVLDARTFRQEYEASFEGAGGRVYYSYSGEKHIDPSIRVDNKVPLVISCDFNVDPCVWVVLQTDGRSVRVIDEVVLRDTNTVAMARETLKRYGGHGAGFTVYGDAAGSHRTTAGKSDYALLFDLGFRDQRIKRTNPPVRDRVNSLCAMLENTEGEVRLKFHPRCVFLRRDLETVQWIDGNAEVDKSNKDLTHATDALGYFIEHEFPLRIQRPDPQRRFYK